MRAHDKFVVIIEPLEHNEERTGVYPSEWKTYVLNPTYCGEGGDVYYRNMLPLQNTPITVETNAPIMCEAIFFQHKQMVGWIGMVALIIYMIALAVGLKWSIAEKNVGAGALILTAFATVPVALLSMTLNLLKES